MLYPIDKLLGFQLELALWTLDLKCTLHKPDLSQPQLNTVWFLLEKIAKESFFFLWTSQETADGLVFRQKIDVMMNIRCESIVLEVDSESLAE